MPTEMVQHVEFGEMSANHGVPGRCLDFAVVGDVERPMREGGIAGLEQTPESTQRADSPSRDGTRKFADLLTPILPSPGP